MPLSTAIDYLETIKIITSHISHEQAFHAHLTAVLDTLSARHGFLRPHIILFDPETGLLKLRVAQDTPRKNHADYAPGKGITGQVFSTAQPVIVPQISLSASFSNLLFERTEEEMQHLAFICVPIFGLPASGDSVFVPREVIGTLGVDSPSLNQEDLAMRCKVLEIVASLVTTHLSHTQEKKAPLASLQQVQANTDCPPFIAQSKKMKLLIEQASQIAQTPQPLLILGEKGSGKEHYARRIHALSTRKYMPFSAYYADNNTLQDEERIKAFWLGYTKNAVPQARQTQKGLIEAANLGTLYIDSIEKIPPIAQEILVQVLTENAITRLGSTQAIHVDIRLIVSSTVDFEALVAQGNFNQELGLRLLANMCFMPPLRERREDIIPLAEFFLELHANHAQNELQHEVKRISYPALDLLSSYYFAGNIPELKQSIEYAVSHSEDSVIRAIDLPPSIQTATSSNTKTDLPLIEAVSFFEKELIVDALVKANGNMFKAAQDLKTSYRIINYKIKKYKLDAKKYHKGQQ